MHNMPAPILRTEALTKDYPDYPVLMNEATASALRDREDITLKSLGLIKVKGRTEPVVKIEPVQKVGS